MAAQNRIVTLRKKELFTTSEVIAENCMLQHKNVIALIRKYIDDFQEISPVAFQTRKGVKLQQGGFAQDTELAILSESQATYLITIFKNTEVVRRFKIELVKEFWRMREILFDPKRMREIQHKRDSHAPMMDALIYAREKAGLPYPDKVFFMNENIMCNEVLTGSHGGINEDDLDAYDAKLLAAIRNHNGMLAQESLNALWREAKLREFTANYRIKKPRPQLKIKDLK